LGTAVRTSPVPLERLKLNPHQFHEVKHKSNLERERERERERENTTRVSTQRNDFNTHALLNVSATRYIQIRFEHILDLHNRGSRGISDQRSIFGERPSRFTFLGTRFNIPCLGIVSRIILEAQFRFDTASGINSSGITQRLNVDSNSIRRLADPFSGF